jgi:ABC-type nitrate/sulfonate/bicarbonate transport system substrate-binding protein
MLRRGRSPHPTHCLCAILLVLLSACSGPPAAAPAGPGPAAAPPPEPAAGAPTAGPPLTLRFAYTALSTTIVPYWIAQEAGYFREEGLEVQDTFISASTVGMQSLLAREIDVTTVTGGAAVQAAANGAELSLFATSVNALISMLMTAPDITAPEQLRGQPLGVVRLGTVSDFVARLLLRNWGLEAGRDVPILQTGGQAETIGAMQSGAVRAVVVADLPALELRRLGYRTFADASDLGREYVGLGVVAVRPYVDGNPEAVRRFVRGLARAMGRFVSDKSYSTQIIEQYTKLTDPEVLESSWEAHTTRYANSSLLTSPEAIRTVQEEVAGDPRAASLDPSTLIDNRFVQELHDNGFLARVYR